MKSGDEPGELNETLDVLRTLLEASESAIKERLMRAREDKDRSAGLDDNQTTLDDASDTDLLLMQYDVQRHAQINSAIARLANGTYHCCRDCQQPISARRLAALPFATRCLECAQQGEGPRPPRPGPDSHAYWRATSR